MFGKTKNNFWLDVTIFTLFLVTALSGLLLWLVLPDGRGSGETIFLGLTRHTWIDLHNWVGLAMLAGVTLHLLLHWKWISCVSRRYFKKVAIRPGSTFRSTACCLSLSCWSISQA